MTGRFRFRTALLHALPLLAVPAAAQTTYVVSGGGAALQAAVNAAAAGDTLDVQPGTYTAVACAKGLRIALRPGAVIDGGGAIALSLANLPPNERFQVDGGAVSGIAGSQCAGTIVVGDVAAQLLAVHAFTSCTGAIVFDGTDYTAFSPSTSGHLQFTNCAAVSFRDCNLPQITLTASRVAMQGCSVRPWGFSAPGVHVVSGSLTVAGGFVTGSAAIFLSIARPAIRIDQGELVLTGGAVVQALQYFTMTAPGVEANGGVVRVDPGAIVTGTPPIAGPASVITAPVASLAVAHAATTMNVTLAGQPGSVVLTFGGVPVPPYATPWGDAWLLPTDPILDVSLLPASGTGGFTRSFASVPPFFVLVLQPVALAPNGALTLGAPTRFVWD